MFLRDDDEEHQNPEDSTGTNFVNPVYETMFEDSHRGAAEDHENNSLNDGPNRQDESSGLLEQHEQATGDHLSQEGDSVIEESMDLLTEKHRGNISL